MVGLGSIPLCLPIILTLYIIIAYLSASDWPIIISSVVSPLAETSYNICSLDSVRRGGSYSKSSEHHAWIK